MTNSLWMIFHVSKGEKLGRGIIFGTLGSIRVGGIYVERSFNANSKKFLEGQFFLWRLRNPPCALVLRFWVFSNPFCAKLEWFKTSRTRWSCNEPKDIPWLWSNRYPLPRPSCYEPKEIPCHGSIGGFSLHPDTRALMSHEPWLPTAPNPWFPEWISMISTNILRLYLINQSMFVFSELNIEKVKTCFIGGKTEQALCFL